GCLEARLELVQHRKVAVDNVVDQRVEHEARAATQKLRLALGSRAHRREADLRAMAHRQHVARADEQVALADLDLLAAVFESDQFGRVQHREQRIAVFLDLRSLMPFARILDRELVQAELLCHLVELLERRLEERDPDEEIRPMHVLADVRDGDIGDLATFFVGDAADEHYWWLPESPPS